MRSIDVVAGGDAKATEYNLLRDDAFGGSQLLAHEQATPDLTLKVQEGYFYIDNGTKVFRSTTNSPSFTAPSANPRIDLLTIDNAGVLARVVGTEGASPSVPAYPSAKIVICEVFNRVGQTKILDVDDSTHGYIQRDARPFFDDPWNVKLYGTQTIAGVKTFGSIPVLPASDPTTANQATRKAYVDLKGLLSFVDTQVFNTDAPSSWTDLDLSSVVGSNRAFVLLRLQNNGANSRLFRFRENGEATEMSGQDSGMTAVFVINGQFTYVLILTDTSGIIEWTTAATVPSTELRVRAYLKL